MCEKVEHVLKGVGRGRVAGLAGSVGIPPPPKIATGATVPEDHLIGVDEVGDSLLDEIRQGVGAKEKVSVRGGSANTDVGSRPGKQGGSAPKVSRRGMWAAGSSTSRTGHPDAGKSDPSRHLGGGVNRGRVDATPPAGGSRVTIDLDAQGKVVGTGVVPGAEIIDAEFVELPDEREAVGTSAALTANGVVGLLEDNGGLLVEDAVVRDPVVVEQLSEAASSAIYFLQGIDSDEISRLVMRFASSSVDCSVVPNTVREVNAFLCVLGYEGADVAQSDLIPVGVELLRVHSGIREAGRNVFDTIFAQVAPGLLGQGQEAPNTVEQVEEADSNSNALRLLRSLILRTKESRELVVIFASGFVARGDDFDVDFSTVPITCDEANAFLRLLGFTGGDLSESDFVVVRDELSCLYDKIMMEFLRIKNVSQVLDFLGTISNDRGLIGLFAQDIIDTSRQNLLVHEFTVESVNGLLQFLDYKGAPLTECDLNSVISSLSDLIVSINLARLSLEKLAKPSAPVEAVAAPAVETSTSEPPPVEEVVAVVVEKLRESAGVPLSPTESFLRYVDLADDGFDQCLVRIRGREKSEGKKLSKPAAARAFQLEAVSEILNVLGYTGAPISSVSPACLDELQLLCARRFTNGDVAALDNSAFHQKVPSFIFGHESAAKAEAVAAIEAERKRNATQIALQRNRSVSKVQAVVPEAVSVVKAKEDLIRFLEGQGRIRSRVSIARDGRDAVIAAERKIALSIGERLGITIDPRDQWFNIVIQLRGGLAKAGLSADDISRLDSVPNFLKPPR